MTNTDLIARLRIESEGAEFSNRYADLCMEAADALTAMQDRIEALVGALKEAADELDFYYWAKYPMYHPIHRRNLKYLLENNPARAVLDAGRNGDGGN